MHVAGKQCARCREAIRGILDGKFCDECGCPVHNKCAASAESDPERGTCRGCGASRSQSRRHEIAVEQAVSEFQQGQLRQLVRSSVILSVMFAALMVFAGCSPLVVILFAAALGSEVWRIRRKSKRNPTESDAV